MLVLKIPHSRNSMMHWKDNSMTDRQYLKERLEMLKQEKHDSIVWQFMKLSCIDAEISAIEAQLNSSKPEILDTNRKVDK